MASSTLNAFLRFEDPPNSKADRTLVAYHKDSKNHKLAVKSPVETENASKQEPQDTREDRAQHDKTPSNTELDQMPIGVGAQYNGPNVSLPPAVYSKNTSSAAQFEDDRQHGSKTPNELEISRPSTPQSTGAAEIIQTIWNPRMNLWRVLSGCLILFGNGMNDSVPGALLPYLEKYYNVGYAIVSMIFIANAVGFILAAFFVHAIDAKLGRARTLMLTDFTLTLAYIAMAVTPPFPVFVVGFLVTGWAMATTLALNNVFCANLAHATIILGVFHGSYGVGGIIAPIIATTMVTRGVLFSRFYFIMVGLRVISFFFAGWAFWRFEEDSKVADIPLTTTTTTQQSSGAQAHASLAEHAQETSKLQGLKQALRNRATLIGAIFIFAYQGAEVAISGWVISFLINYRGSDPGKVGYVTAGFWGGITVGRFTLSYAAQRLGEKAFTYGLVAGAIAFQLLVWFVPNVIGDTVAIALLGLLLGPIYPSATTVFTRLLPRRLQNTALAFISSAGSSGGAVAPFLTGLLAQATGTWVLHPICIVMFVLMQICWFLLPKQRKRSE